MPLNLRNFFAACDPSKTLNLSNADDRAYYIDFASVRGGKIIDQLERTIVRLFPHKPTCQLFTGHIGCGKSTELSRLKAELQAEGFHVIYFESTEDLDETDIDITDILLAIARRISSSLEKVVDLPTRHFRDFLKEMGEFLNTPIRVDELKLSLGIAEITSKLANSRNLRSRLRQHLEPQTTRLLNLINEDIIAEAQKQLKSRGYQGIVVIIDNLDRVEDRANVAGRRLPNYIFIDRGEQLRKLNCHLVYTVPLALLFSKEAVTLNQRLGGGVPAKVLPMVPVQNKDGTECVEGMKLLQQMVLVRAFPEVKPDERIAKIREVFDRPETLDRLCRASGGHARKLLGMVYGCIQQVDPPIPRSVLEDVIQKERDALEARIDDREWNLLLQVANEQKVNGEEEFQTLLKSLFVFEYYDRHCQERWFGLNPLIRETERYKRSGLPTQISN